MISGGTGNDTLFGGNGHDTINGGDGSDTIDGGSGGDILDGGNGSGDTLTYANSKQAVYVNLGTGTGSGGDATGDTISNFEIVIGTNKADTLIGGKGNDTINGGGNDDTIRGDDGNDRLTGSGGLDILWGGAGDDIFVLSPAVDDWDLIADFSAGDKLEISASLFGGDLVAGAPLDESQFVSNFFGVAEDEDDRFIFSYVTGELYYDEMVV